MDDQEARVIAKLGKPEKEILRALRDPERRREAFELLAGRFPGAPVFEAAVLEAAWREPRPDVRAAAVLAARHYEGEGATAALLEALKTDAARREATRCLRVSSRPGLTERLLAELDVALAADDPGWSRAVLRALSCRRDPAIPRKALALLDSHGEDAAALVAAGEDVDALRALAGRVNAPDPGVMAKAVEAAFRLGPDEAFERLAPLLLPKERPTSAMVARAREILREARRWPDPRWPELILEIVEARAGLGIGPRVRALLGDVPLKHGYPVEHLLAALPGFGFDGAARRLWRILEGGGRLEAHVLAAAVAKIEGPNAFLPLLKRTRGLLDEALLNFFERMADGPARVVELRGLFAAQPSDGLARLLARLESRFPAR